MQTSNAPRCFIPHQNTFLLHITGLHPGPPGSSSSYVTTRLSETSTLPVFDLHSTEYSSRFLYRVVRTRPVCPYPQRAVWSGTGDRNREDGYRCQ